MDFSDFTTQIVSTLKANQFMTGGVVTVVVGFVMRYANSIWNTFYGNIKRFISIEFYIGTRHSIYPNIAKFSYKNRVKFWSRTFSLAFYGRDEKSIIPGYGTSFGMYKGVLYTTTKSRIDSKNDIEEEMTFTFFTRDKSIVGDFIKDSMDDNNLKNITLVSFQDGTYFSSAGHKVKRDFSSVFVNKNVKDILETKIKFFINNRKWYEERGIPWKICILLHGIPGTGKTSICRALAAHFDMNLLFINNLSNLDKLLSRISDKSDEEVKHNTVKDIFMIEDIDTLGSIGARGVKTGGIGSSLDELDEDGPASSNASSEEDDIPSFGAELQKKNIHTLLNSLDGMSTPEGSIFIITTNHLEHLDPAIFRPGRIDILLEIGKLEFEPAVEMFSRFFPDNNIDFKDYKETYIEKTGAELQQILMTNIYNDVNQTANIFFN